MQSQIETRFNARSTGDDVISDVDLTGKLALVTGASAGIGKETARVLAAAGADVLMASRTSASLASAAEEVRMSARGKVWSQEVDLFSLASVARFADETLLRAKRLDLLILNAGVMACPLARSAEGIESQLATNFIGHALLTSRLVPALLASPAPRVISLSSRAHQMSPVIFEDINYERRPYDPWEAYGQSKTATSLLAVKIWLTLGGHGVTVHALHPGGIKTGLLKYVTGDIAAQLSHKYRFDSSAIQVKTIPQGAATTVWAATEPALMNHEALYLEDCGVAPLLDTPTYTHGVMRYAVDPDHALAIWGAAEKLIGSAMPLEPR